MVQAEAQPTLSRELQGPAHEIPNYVRMANDQLVAVLLLRRLCPMEVLPESGLDAGTVLEELLKNTTS